MSADFDRLKAKLAEGGQITDEEITGATLTDEEKFWLNAERYTKQREQKISMEQYLAASKVLDTAPEGSPEFLEAEKIVTAYESGN